MWLRSHENGRWKGQFFIFIHAIRITQILMNHRFFEVYSFLRYSVTRRRFVRIVVRLWIWQCTRYCFAHLGPRRGRYFLSGWGSMSLTTHTTPLLERLRCVLDGSRGFLRRHHAQAEWERQGLKRQRTLLARACLMTMCKNVYIMYILG